MYFIDLNAKNIPSDITEDEEEENNRAKGKDSRGKEGDLAGKKEEGASARAIKLWTLGCGQFETNCIQLEAKNCQLAEEVEEEGGTQQNLDGTKHNACVYHGIKYHLSLS
jgi:hypothetical protein